MLLHKGNNELTISVLKASVNIAFLATIIISYKLWTNIERSIPGIPVINLIRFDLPSYLTVFLVGVLGVSLVMIVSFKKPHYFLLINLLVSLLLVLFDINRLQPSIYLFLTVNSILFIYFSGKLNEDELLNLVRLLLCAVYFWSGIHKWNQNYYESIYLWLAEPYLTYFKNPSSQYLIKSLGHISPFIEVFMSIGLLFKRTRNLSACLVVLMHLIIIVTIVFIKDFNTSILPWNLTLILIVFICFYNRSFSFSDLFSGIGNKRILPFIILFWILPLFNFIGYWDAYLSHDLYSGKAKFGFVYFNDGVKSRLPLRYARYIEQVNGQNYISLTKWSMEEIHVPVYPEVRVFERYRSLIGKYAHKDDKIVLVSFSQNASEIIE